MLNLVNFIHNKRAFVWDFDGCLVDSEPHHYAAYRQAFSNFGHKISEVDYYESFTNRGGGLQREIDRNSLCCAAQEVFIVKEQLYREAIRRHEVSVFPEVPEILARLREHGRQIAIASNSCPKDLHDILKFHSLSDKFDVIIGKTDTCRSKPEPDLYLIALKNLNIEAHQTLAFEDSDCGLSAAGAAGCDVMLLKAAHNEQVVHTARRKAELSHKDLLSAICEAFP